jgi:hypothetical protein
VNGKCQQSFSGPKYLLPSNGPLHERTYAPMYPGMTCEKVKYVMGDREEKFNLGSHKTQVLISNLTYETDLGTWKARAIGSSLEMGASGIKGTALAGMVSLTASSGSASMTGMTSANLIASGGQAMVRGSTGVYLGGPVSEIGSILVSGSREPFTNLPYLTWGLGAKAFNIGG